MIRKVMINLVFTMFVLFMMSAATFAEIYVADDFEGKELDTSLWTLRGFDENQVVEYVMSDGLLQLEKYSGCIWIETKQEFEQQTLAGRVRFRLNLPFLMPGDNHIEVQFAGMNSSITVAPSKHKISLRFPKLDWKEPEELIIENRFPPNSTIIMEVIALRDGEDIKAWIYEVVEGKKNLIGDIQWSAPQRVESIDPPSKKFSVVQWQFAGTLDLDYIIVGDSVGAVETYEF